MMAQPAPVAEFQGRRDGWFFKVVIEIPPHAQFDMMTFLASRAPIRKRRPYRSIPMAKTHPTNFSNRSRRAFHCSPVLTQRCPSHTRSFRLSSRLDIRETCGKRGRLGIHGLFLRLGKDAVSILDFDEFDHCSLQRTTGPLDVLFHGYFWFVPSTPRCIRSWVRRCNHIMAS